MREDIFEDYLKENSLVLDKLSDFEIENIKKSLEYKYSLDSIYEDIIDFTDGSEEQTMMLVGIIRKLPKGVIDYILENYTFTWASNYFGICLPPKKRGVIILSDALLKESYQYIEYTICHEIAHAFLRHNEDTEFLRQDMESYEVTEKEADELALAWLKLKKKPSLKEETT